MNFKKILYFIIGKEYHEDLEYPRDFAFIDYSPVAKQKGVRDNKNKMIYRYFINKYGNRELKTYRYSEERIHSLREVYNIPVFDKTKTEEILPIFGKALPSEASFIS